MISQTFIIWSFLHLYIVHFLKETKHKEKVKTNIFFSFLFYTVTVCRSLFRIWMVDGLMLTEWEQQEFRSRVTFTGIPQDRRRATWRLLELLRFVRISHTRCRGHSTSCLRHRQLLTFDLCPPPPPGRAKGLLAFVYICVSALWTYLL